MEGRCPTGYPSNRGIRKSPSCGGFSGSTYAPSSNQGSYNIPNAATPTDCPGNAHQSSPLINSNIFTDDQTNLRSNGPRTNGSE